MTSDRLASDHLGSVPTGSAEIIALGPRTLETAHGSAGDLTEDMGALAQAVRDQLARDIADIEKAAAALRRAEPALESWSTAPPPKPASQPRPLWLLIGLLWLSAALVTVGAVTAIAIYAG
jgi:hypothetical protein